jgi:membrane protein
MSLASLQTLWQFASQVVKRFEQDRCQRVAGSLSFTTTLAIVPLTAVVLAVLSLAPGFSAWMTVIQDFIYSNFAPAAGEVVQKYLTQLAGKSGRLTAIGLLFLGVTAVMLLATIEQALNDIWRVANTRKLLRRFLTYSALLTLGPLLAALSLTLTSKLFMLSFLGRAEVTFMRELFGVVLPLAFEFGAVVLLYTVVPNVPVLWRSALAGGLFAAVLLEIAKYLFAASMKTFTAYQIIYGAIAALPIFLIWIYISWVIVLLGAIVTATLNDRQWTGKIGKKGKTAKAAAG